MTRRSQMEIYIDILRAIAVGKKRPTHIMYRANLSWIRLKKHLDFMLTQNLIEEGIIDGKLMSVYNLTSKGKGVLEYFKKIENKIYENKKHVEIYQ